ncbi:hypothetical protein Q5H93_14820 [Hymenobacter sp. ASUV-10]|uniref:Helix-turn-helix domain-containing protein n=1 Tax=Hymenobacter aranciens TaxID=3063996 RepID=A0ABT9BCM7_9BACT|nr:hypothetical protein [Hymenobacter sp. ASUV-10]MDO7876014.1 hypothetical protein [Hymenobacter sp. ASUV-10]
MRFSQFIDRQSEKLHKVWRKRTLKDGTVQHYAVRPSILSDGAEKTGWALIRLAIRAVLELRKTPLLAQELASGDPPPLAVNSEELARTGVRGKRVAGRTIRNHITELLQAGILLRKKFRGRQHDYYVWVNPRFLWETPQEAEKTTPQADFQATGNGVATLPPGTNFPPKGVHEPVKATEMETGHVDKLLPVSTLAQPIQHQATHSGYTGLLPADEKAAPGPETPPDASQAAVTPSESVAPPASAPGPKTRLARRQHDMVREAWWAFQREVYGPRNMRFSEEQGRLALNAAYFGIYGGFPADWPLTYQERYHEQVLERIGLVAAYFTRNPEKYPPMPYAEHVAGKGYFDAENERGFIGTMKWYQTHLMHRQQRAMAEGLSRARREMSQHLRGVAPKKVQSKTTLELYRYHEQRMRTISPQALERFYQHFSRPVVA